MARLPTNSRRVWDQAVRVRAQSRWLREQLACVAEQVAAVEEQCAAIHDAMAAQLGPVVGAAARAARARQFAAVERAMARAYRQGVVPPDVAWATLRIDWSVGAGPGVRPTEG